MQFSPVSFGHVTAIVIAVTVLLEPTVHAQQDQMPPADAMAWVLGTKLGIAAVGKEAGAGEETVGNMMQTAKVIADALGTEPPQLPERGSLSKSEYGARILGFLLRETKPIGEHLANQHGQRAADLFEIAIKSSVLGIMYAPQDETGLNIADVIENRANRAKLDQQLWQPLVRDIRAGASYDQVKKRLFQMHETVRADLMGE